MIKGLLGIIISMFLFIGCSTGLTVKNINHVGTKTYISDAWSSCVKTRPRMGSNWCEGSLRKVTVEIVNPVGVDTVATVACRFKDNYLFGIKEHVVIKRFSKKTILIYGLSGPTGFLNYIDCELE